MAMTMALTGIGSPIPGRHVGAYVDSAVTLECGVEVAAPFAGGARVASARPSAGARREGHGPQVGPAARLRTNIFHLLAP
jgi:hypothetical protein